MCSNINYRFEPRKKTIRFEKEHCHAANKGSRGAMKIKQIIKDRS